MRNVIKLENLQEIAKSHGGECLSTEYVRAKTKYLWRCKNGHEWPAQWDGIKNGKWCVKCYREELSKQTRKHTVETVNEKIKHRNIQMLVRIKNKGEFICLVCNNPWKTRIGHVLDGHGCPWCAGKMLTIDDVLEIARKSGFKLLSKKYRGCEYKYKWKCENGHTWPAKPCTIRNGKGCPECRISIKEHKSKFIFEQLTGKKFPKDKKTLSNLLELDGYCEELKLAFEYQGHQHYRFIRMWHQSEKSFEEQKKRDKTKQELCIHKNINLILIPYFEAETDEQLETFIKNQLLKFDIKTTGNIDWSKYKRTEPKLKEFIDICKKRKIKCLSKSYPGRHGKVNLRCLICKNPWTTTVGCIKCGFGCPACGHKKTWEKRKLSLDKFDETWEIKYNTLLEFVKKYSMLPRHHAKDRDENHLHGWVRYQKSRKLENNLTNYRQEKLNNIPGWEW